MALGLLLWMFAFVAVGYFVRQFRLANGAVERTTPDQLSTRESVSLSDAAIRVLQVAPIVVCAWYVWTESRSRPLEEGRGDIVAMWLLTMALAIVAVAWPIERPNPARLIAWTKTYTYEIAAVAIITGVALVVRVVALDTDSWIYSGDEGTFGLYARDVLEDRLKNPFSTGLQAHPTLWFFLQAGTMKVFGNDVVGSRMLSAVLGSATVPVAYLFVRRHLGIWTAITAASLLAIFHVHLFWSRDAQNNISAAFFVVLVLWLLDRVIDKWRPIDALVAGLAIGIGQHFFVSNRLLAPLAALFLAYALVATRPLTADALRATGRRVVASASLIAGGIILGFLPLAAYYIDHRETYTQRIKIVSIFSSGWLEQERLLTGRSDVAIIWENLKTAALLPTHTTPAPTFYHPPPPLIGWPLVVPFVIGLTLTTVAFWQRKHFGLVAIYWVNVVGLAFTIGPSEVSRFSMAVSLIPIFAAVGIVEVARRAASFLRIPKVVAVVAVAGVVVGIGYWNINFYFNDTEPDSRHSDFNTRVADTFAYELQDLGPEWTVYYAAPPRMYYRGHPSLPFIARGNVGIDVTEPWSESADPPVLTGPTVFFFLPERRSELAVVQSWFPGGEVVDRVDEAGTPLYTEYLVVPEEVPPSPA